MGGHAAESPEQAVDAYLAVMAWGFGDSVGYGRFRTQRILDENPDAPERLHAVALAVVNDGAIAGYRALATTSRLAFLGPSFGTKLLYFCQPPDTRPRALIFDAFVGGWLDREARVRIDAVQWSVAAYTRYLTQMHEWADSLGIAPDELEMCIFRDEAARRPDNQANREPTPRPKRRAELSPGALPFDAYPEGGVHRLKWVVTEDGKPIVTPAKVGEYAGSKAIELSHASMTNGESVRAAGEAYFAPEGAPLLITGHGGHYRPGAGALDIGASALRRASFTFDSIGDITYGLPSPFTPTGFLTPPAGMGRVR